MIRIGIDSPGNFDFNIVKIKKNSIQLFTRKNFLKKERNMKKTAVLTGLFAGILVFAAGQAEARKPTAEQKQQAEAKCKAKDMNMTGKALKKCINKELKKMK
jgi:hypothetical protein